KSARYPEIDGNDGYALPMIGRQEELQRINQFLGQAREGLGQSVSLFADVGMGKTRLVAESLKQAKASGFQILQGECQTFGTNTLYTPWWSVWRKFFGLQKSESPQEAEAILRQRLAEIDERLVPRLPLLGPVLNIRLEDNELTRAFDAKLRRASLDSLLIDCLRSATAKRPVLIVLEDVQAIDEVSRDLLRTIVQATARLPLMLLLAMRSAAQEHVLSPAEKSLDYVHSIELKEFTEAEAAQLIRLKKSQLFGKGTDLPAEVIVKIYERTGGNPFFIDEVMNWMHHQKIDFTSIDALEEAELPVSLHALVLSRMDQLTEQPRITMKVASVIGQVFRAAAVWSVYPELGGPKEVKNALAVLSEKDFIEVDQKDTQLAYLFKHVVLHEVAYESLTKQVRDRLHEAIGLFMEEYYPTNRPHVLDLLAFHFGRSNNVYKKRKYLLEAGDAAREAYSNSAAAEYYEAVLPLLDEADRVEVLSNLGRVQEISGDWKKAMETFRQGLELAERFGKALEAANCRLEVGDLFRKTGSFEEASAWLAQAKAEFESLGNEEGMGQVLHSEGTLAAQKGEFDTARERYTKSIEIRRKIGDNLKVASLLGNMGIILHFQGQEKLALEHQEQSLAIRKELNDPWHLGNSYNNLGMVKRYMGDFAGARASLEEALKMFEKVGERAETANTLTSLAELAVDLHDTEACESYLLESLRLQRELGNLQGLAFLLEAFASNAFNQERPERCLRLFGAAQALRTSIGAPRPEIDEEKIGKIIDQAKQSIQEK
ncbi:MAG TPA: tetratricopeptide repeat protein, partial [Oceanipulchritudo sp.]|nr:tetratricopeptide repeat protein [Oceanipulchritudo sp.]